MSKLQFPPTLQIEAIGSDGVEVRECVNSDIVLHTIGLDRPNAKVYHRHGKAFYWPCRNYYSTYVGGTTWTLLCKAGYAKYGEVFHHEDGNTTIYWLTRKGLDWLGAEIGVHIYDEER